VNAGTRERANVDTRRHLRQLARCEATLGSHAPQPTALAVTRGPVHRSGWDWLAGRLSNGTSGPGACARRRPDPTADDQAGHRPSRIGRASHRPTGGEAFAIGGSGRCTLAFASRGGGVAIASQARGGRRGR